MLTPQYNVDSFGYSSKVHNKHESKNRVNVIQVSNGTNGKINFGTVENWKILYDNTAKIINDMNKNKFDKIITICNDAPFARLVELINEDKNHLQNLWKQSNQCSRKKTPKK